MIDIIHENEIFDKTIYIYILYNTYMFIFIYIYIYQIILRSYIIYSYSILYTIYLF